MSIERVGLKRNFYKQDFSKTETKYVYVHLPELSLASLESRIYAQEMQKSYHNLKSI